MSRIKGSPKTGGRKKGTKNKVTTELKTWIEEIINDQRDKFIENLKSLSPNDHVAAIVKLLSFSVPKLQAVSIKEQKEAEYNELRRLLEELPEKAINEITNKVLELNKDSNNEQ